MSMTSPWQESAGNAAMPPKNTIVETKVVPVVERRSAIRATGYAVISVQPSDVDAQQRLLAIRASKLDAYRGLTEQVYGQYLDATTTVADMAVLSDTFRTQVEGVIYGAKVVSIAPVGEDTYETTMSLDQDVVDDLRALYLASIASR
ncbi:LPP20 family lipoprotein [Litoricolaceae bacterium]|nr:LPP20 family lipoprotein [Litorivicinaceae bacterium]